MAWYNQHLRKEVLRFVEYLEFKQSERRPEKSEVTNMMEVTLQLPDHLYEKAKQWAAITQQELDVALMDALDLVLAPVSVAPELEEPVANLSNEELLEQANMKMLPEQGRRLSRLLGWHREGRLSEEEHRELFALAQLYQRLWLRQSEALAEAVRRGSHPPMHS